MAFLQIKSNPRFRAFLLNSDYDDSTICCQVIGNRQTGAGRHFRKKARRELGRTPKPRKQRLPSAAPSQPTTHNSQPNSQLHNPQSQSQSKLSRRHACYRNSLFFSGFSALCLCASGAFAFVVRSWRESMPGVSFSIRSLERHALGLGVSHSACIIWSFGCGAAYSHAWFQTHSDAWCAPQLRKRHDAACVLWFCAMDARPAFALLVVFLASFA
jgi:hypothetical protein